MEDLVVDLFILGKASNKQKKVWNTFQNPPIHPPSMEKKIKIIFNLTKNQIRANLAANIDTAAGPVVDGTPG